ncbi:MAG: Crp/Fnr family transcriptional regulator [Burkholderiales bacterium]
MEPTATPATHTAPDSASPGSPRTRALTEVPALTEAAIELLRTPNALAMLSADDALVVVTHMRLVSFPAGALMLREGDQSPSSYMLLVLTGDVSVEMNDPSGTHPMEVSVLGPGSLIGEMALLDGEARSVSCVATSIVQAGGLSRKALERLIEVHPKVAARLMVAIAKRLSDRLRAVSQQLAMMASMKTP